ncbi:MAG: hypothetical protein RBS39_13885, partial [Phycisphaerales bacterium]|nr:hypothetical protein [Phycisphaerales bacterium]
AAALDRASRVPTPDALRVARVLERSPAALIVAPPREDSTAPNTAAHTPRVTAVPLERLFPPTDLSAGAVRADVKRNAESLLASALGVVSSDAPPIVVFVHAALEDMLAPNAPIVKLAERLALRGIDTLEWRVESGASNPSTASPSTPSQSSESDPGAAPAGTLPGDAALRTALASLDPSGARPVVYAIVPSPSQAPGGIERAHALSRALRSVLASDAPVLVSLLPSSLPSIGQGDPVAASLASYGVKADTARPILGDVATTQGRVVASDHEVAPADTDQPIARALRGLPLMLPWPVPLDPPAGWDALLTLERQGEGRALWGESEWIAYASIPNDQKSLVPDPPRPDAARDDVRDAFIVAAAGRRRDAQTDAISASNAAGGRTIVVSSGWWMLDRVALAEQRIENRTSLVWPGNAELFEACVDWLAGHDALIAQGVQARAVARIEPIDPQTLSRLRWGVLAGLPLLTLVLGGLWRLIRG